MKKFKLLKFGHYYINKEGDFAIVVLGGNQKMGYQTFGSHANPSVFLGKFQLLSRVIPDDENWIEIDFQMFNVVSTFHASGHVVSLPAKNDGKTPLISKKY